MAGHKTCAAKAGLLCAALLASTGALRGQQGAPATAQGPGTAAGQTATTTGQTATTITEPPTPLLPTNEHLLAGSAAADVPAETADETAILKECGLKRQESRAVVSGPEGSPKPVGFINAYQFVDATGALSAYTFFGQGGKSHSAAEGSSEMELPGGKLVVLDGVSVVRVEVREDRAAVDALLRTVEIGLPKVGGRRGLPPVLPRLLPKGGLAQESLRYALGPVSYKNMGGVLPAEILGWDRSAEVATTRYSGKAGSGTLTLLMYPTPEIAGERGRAIQSVLDAGGRAELRGARLRRLGPMLAMASGGFTAAQAETMVNSVHLNQEVIFDKAMPTEFHTEIKKTATLLEQIALFVGVGILAALVLGIFFGGGRAAIRVMQGKPAWVDPEFLHIDLRGRPEPLKPSQEPQQDLASR